MTNLTRGGATNGPSPTKVFAYLSRPAPRLTIDDVRSLIFEARGFNAMNGIAGLLTYDRRGFLQAIEGTVEALDALAARIAADPRHREMQIVFDRPVPTRQFHSFHDFLCADDNVASLSLLPKSSREHLSDEIVAAIDRGYRAL